MIKKETIAFCIITQKRRTKPFLLFIDSYVNSFNITHFNSEIVPQKAVAKLQSEFWKKQGVFFCSEELILNL